MTIFFKVLAKRSLLSIKASRKRAHDKVFLFRGKKAIFLQKMVAPSKKIIALNMYIGTNVLM